MQALGQKRRVVILFGPPGSGKGTQASRLAAHFGWVHISTGDVFRRHIQEKTDLGQKVQQYIEAGQLVPDAITVAMLQEEMQRHSHARGFILDGFPRTIAQAEALDAMLVANGMEVDGLIALDVPEGELIERIQIRSRTSGRADDADPEVIQERLKVYHSQTAPVYEYYDRQGKAITIDGTGTIEQITQRLVETIESLVNST